MREELEVLIKHIVEDLENNQINDRVDSYNDFKSKYVVLKPLVKVRIELTSGKVAEIDVTDYFEGVVR